jgi:6-pyruvoyltetrahydropterin/6-carboxytetrahydropterin synthase
MIIGKEFKFESAHHLPFHPKCGQTHGHTYVITVEVEGEVDPYTGMVMDLHDLSNEVNSLIRHWDHNDLNSFMPLPTCENIAQAVWDHLALHIALKSVKIQEGVGGYAIKLG